jgi:hypothetical protein
LLIKVYLRVEYRRVIPNPSTLFLHKLTIIRMLDSRMDQAASVLSRASSALYVSFYPRLSAQPISLPPGAAFVCANSLVVSDKVVHARTRYNLRVVETLVAARVLARKLGLPLDEDGQGREKVTLREVLGRLVSEGERHLDEDALQRALEKAVAAVEVLRPEKNEEGQLGVTKQEMVKMSGLEEEEFSKVYFSWTDGEFFSINPTG